MSENCQNRNNLQTISGINYFGTVLTASICRKPLQQHLQNKFRRHRLTNNPNFITLLPPLFKNTHQPQEEQNHDIVEL